MSIHCEVTQAEISEIGSRFELPGPVKDGAPYGNGHINDTFLVNAGSPGGEARFIFQRINHEIFRDVASLMENIRRVTEHVRRKLAAAACPDPSRQALTLIRAKDGSCFFRAAGGDCWRVYEFLEGTETIEVVESCRQAREAARAFAGFQEMLMDLPPPALHETIPDFHHTPKRLAALGRAVRRDVCGRAGEVAKELGMIDARRELCGVLVDRLEAGGLPLRTTHNDTKINNIRFDLRTGRGGAVIDLDTVMPGLVHYDFGDMVRTCCFTGTEDDPDLSRATLRLDIHAAVVAGFLEGGRGFLTPAEIACLPFAGPLICLEIGIRFLTDYLEGDVYFKTSRPGHNLERARVQLRRVELLEQAAEEIGEIFRRV